MEEPANPRPKILVVDDVAANANVLRETLEPEGYDVSIAKSGEIALKLVTKLLPDLILLDVVMPGGIDGFETCRRLKADPATAEIPIVFITASLEPGKVVDGFRVGGSDYIMKPIQDDEVRVRVATHLTNRFLSEELAQKVADLKAEKARRKQVEGKLSIISQREAQQWGLDAFIGQSASFQAIIDGIRKLQKHANLGVLICGESGTGKELIARAIHFGSERAEGGFVPVNCSAIPKDLAESLLFGHCKGAFTGADKELKGYFELADGGTLFLDEIGDMPVTLQAKILRALEDGKITPLGAAGERTVDVRVVAATNADLRERIAVSEFREDLFYRLSQYHIDVPPLRDRNGDATALANHFLKTFAEKMAHGQVPVFSKAALQKLERYAFPGNVRELRNVIERALLECEGEETVQPNHLLLGSAGVPLAELPSPCEPGASVSGASELERLYRSIIDGEGNFWELVRDPFLSRDLNRDQVRAVIARGLEASSGNYKTMMTSFGLPEDAYQKFMDFLRHHRLK